MDTTRSPAIDQSRFKIVPGRLTLDGTPGLSRIVNLVELEWDDSDTLVIDELRIPIPGTIPALYTVACDVAIEARWYREDDGNIIIEVAAYGAPVSGAIWDAYVYLPGDHHLYAPLAALIERTYDDLNTSAPTSEHSTYRAIRGRVA